MTPLALQLVAVALHSLGAFLAVRKLMGEHTP